MRSFSLVAVLILAAMLSGCHWKAELYSATAEMEIRPRGITDFQGFLNSAATDKPENQDAFQKEVKIIQSPDILVPIIKNQGLDRIWAQRFKTGQVIMPIMEALHHLQKNLTIELVRGTNIIRVTARSEIPQEAADIANGVVDGYKAARETEEQQRNKLGIDALHDQIVQQQAVVVRAGAAVDELRSKATANPGSDPTALFDADQNLRKQQGLLDALNSRLGQLEADSQLLENPVRIISRAVPPPE
ncbi:MAG: hypothetical protein LV481_09065 [Methylacidiphilales bacterium]|nr:hypothetical protein [Candidatus Methylacidiphilales bacterium]